MVASGSARVQPGGKQSGPGGISSCHEAAMPEPSSPCYSVIYSVGINGGAGEVGTHVGFNPAAVGNLFLGMNAPHLASNAGSFHITVLIIPSGTFTGLWIAPEDGFTVQGTTLKLSAYVFAQNATIDEVRFTMAVPGQAPLSICNAFKSGEDIYTCGRPLGTKRSTYHNGEGTQAYKKKVKVKSGEGWSVVRNPNRTHTVMVMFLEIQPDDIHTKKAPTDFTMLAAYQKVTVRL